MNKLKTTLTSLCLFIITLLSATTYYVDATAGNDAFAGTSEATAWQSIEKVNDEMSTFNGGDKILFKRGEIWKGSRLYIENVSGMEGALISFGAYGNGDKPIISSVITQAHIWTNIGSNIWRANNSPADHPQRMLIDGAEKLRTNLQSELDGIHFFWFYNENTSDLYLYSTENPNNSTFEYSIDFPIIMGETSYISLQNLDIQGGWTGIFINILAQNIYLSHLDIGKYCSNGIVTNTSSILPTQYPQNLFIEDCNFDAYFDFDYSSAGEYQGSFDRGVGDGIRAEALIGGEIKNCYFKNWGHASFSLNGGEFQKVSAISCHDNYMTSPDICYGGRLNIEDTHHNEIFNNQIINTSVQSQMNGQFNHYHHNIFNGTTNTPLLSNGFGVGISISAYANTSLNDNIYEHNLIINTEGAGIQISGNNEYDIFDNIIRNNIIYNCGITVNNKGVEVEANEFEETYNNSFLNNLVYNVNSMQTCNFRGTTTDITGFNELTGSDGYTMMDNIAGKPLFLDENNEDWHLSANSPCIDAGTLPLSTLDFDGNMIPLTSALVDIGIYEYQSVMAVDNLGSFAVSLAENHVMLTWLTVNETNNKGFEIQRSTNARDWESIAWIAGNRSTTAIHRYTFVDKKPFTGTNYYRYKQIGLDEKYVFSKMLDIQYQDKLFFNVFPNPASNKLILQLPENLLVNISLSDVHGKRHLYHHTNGGQIHLDLKGLPDGIYWISIQTREAILTKKIILRK